MNYVRSFAPLGIRSARIGLLLYCGAAITGLCAVVLTLKLQYGLSLWDLAGQPCTFVLPQNPGVAGSPLRLFVLSAMQFDHPALLT
jgi:hypothetical protein